MGKSCKVSDWLARLLHSVSPLADKSGGGAAEYAECWIFKVCTEQDPCVLIGREKFNYQKIILCVQWGWVDRYRFPANHQ